MSKAALPSTESAPDIRRWPTPRSKAWTLQFLNEAVDNDDIKAIVAVGSAVRPAVPCADLDLLVVCKEPANLRVRPPLEIDLRKYRADQVHQELARARGNNLLGWAIKFGRVLFQREDYWNAVSEFWRDKLPLPPPYVAEQRADAAFRRLTKVLEIGDFDAAEEQALSYATHLARAELLKQNVYPASRPELPVQLRQIGSHEAADFFEQIIDRTVDHSKQISMLVETRRLTCGFTRRRPRGAPSSSSTRGRLG
jgi:hypothetical protein